ncbi:MAG: hypothetical protein IT383_03610 [Deltaproteobacteria bacterium]|nr:hypothetical protein [Deltaproteobacteria bacterium]
MLALAPLLVLLASADPAANPAPQKPELDAAWVARMDALAVSIAALLPEVAMPTPTDVAARAARDERLRQHTRALAALAHGVATSRRLPDGDPTVALLSSELEASVAELSKRDGERLRDAAFVVAATCIGCHTRTDRGAPRPRASLAPVDSKLPAWLRADVLAATRRFQEARIAYRAAVADERFAEREPLLWERAVKRAMVLDVRVARDPQGALALVERVLATPGAQPLWQDAVGWRGSLRRWAAEKPKPDSLAELEAQAQRLLDEAAGLERTPDGSGADVLYLRATAALHELLARDPPAPVRAVALAGLGLAYEKLKDVDIWALYATYDEACIEAAPHSLLAGECFERLERALKEDYLGNSGGALPADVAAKLTRLRALAATVPTTPKGI